MNQHPVSRPALLAPLEPNEWPEQVPVLIVGGGPVGLTSAMLLAQQGIEVMLIERRSFESRFPRAHLLNVRTMEIFDEMKVADDIYALSPSDDDWRKVVWYTSLDGPTPEHGMKIGEIPAWGGGEDAQAYEKSSPLKFANLPQIRLDQLVWKHVDATAPGRIRAFQELVGLQQDESGVLADILDRKSGETRQIRAQYVIAADGGRVSSDLLGVDREGPQKIQDVISCYVSADFSLWKEKSALLAHFIQPWRGGKSVGTMQALGPHHYGRNSPEWLVARARKPGEELSDDPETLIAGMRDLLGLAEDHPIDLHAVSHWTYEGIVADRFRVGSVFLAGDAAHRHPPTGGLGLNGGVQDAHNLAWKLAAVLRGKAPDSLLDSYEWERRPVAAHNTAHSLENAGRHAPIGSALGLRPDLTESEGWNELAIFNSESEAGDQRREAVAQAVADNAHDYSQLNVEAGFGYVAGALVPDDERQEVVLGSPIDFIANARPGSHLPHRWVQGDHDLGQDRKASTLDLVAADALTLLVREESRKLWQQSVNALSLASMPIEVAIVPNTIDDWDEICGIQAGGAVLVRPDKKVAWRARTLPEDPTRVLEEARTTVLSGGEQPSQDPAEPFLERIRLAAAGLVAH